MHKQERRHAGTLTPRHNRLVDLVLGTGDFDEATVTSASLIYNRLAAEVARFQAGRITHERGRISKADAARMLGKAMARLRQGGDV